MSKHEIHNDQENDQTSFTLQQIGGIVNIYVNNMLKTTGTKNFSIGGHVSQANDESLVVNDAEYVFGGCGYVGKESKKQTEQRRKLALDNFNNAIKGL